MEEARNKDRGPQHPKFESHDEYLAQSREMEFVEIMNEFEASHRWCGWAEMYGAITRLENAAGASIPDAIFMCQGYMGWMEIKIRYGRYIYGPPFQMAYAVRIGQHIHDWQHHYIVYDESDSFKVYTVKQIRSAPQVIRGNKVRYDISEVQPVFKVEDSRQFEKFVGYLLMCAFD